MEVPAREGSSELSQGRRARGGPRAPRGQEPHTWHPVDLGGFRGVPRSWGDTRVPAWNAWESGTCLVFTRLCWPLSRGREEGKRPVPLHLQT